MQKERLASLVFYRSWSLSTAPLLLIFYRKKKKFPIDFSANAGRTRGIERTSLVQTPAKTDEEKQS
jgi:hypothetical protein